MQIKNNSANPIIFIDQPKDNLNPKMQLKLLNLLYKELRYTWLENIQFFMITHSIYFISEFVNDDDAIIYNFNNYKPLKYDEKDGLLISYNIKGFSYPSWDEVAYLIDQIPTFNVYCSLYEILNVYTSTKYKDRIKKLNGKSPCSKCKLEKDKNIINGLEYLVEKKYKKLLKKLIKNMVLNIFVNYVIFLFIKFLIKKVKTEN